MLLNWEPSDSETDSIPKCHCASSVATNIVCGATIFIVLLIACLAEVRCITNGLGVAVLWREWKGSVNSENLFLSNLKKGFWISNASQSNLLQFRQQDYRGHWIPNQFLFKLLKCHSFLSILWINMFIYANPWILVHNSIRMRRSFVKNCA